MNGYEYWLIPCKYGVETPTTEEEIHLKLLVNKIKKNNQVISTTLYTIGAYMNDKKETSYKTLIEYFKRSKVGKLNNLHNITITSEEIQSVIKQREENEKLFKEIRNLRRQKND